MKYGLPKKTNPLGFNEFVQQPIEMDEPGDYSETEGTVQGNAIANSKIFDLDVNKLRAGTISSQEIILGVDGGFGDTFIAGGTYTASAWTADGGFILGIDDSDSDKEKFYIGKSSTSSFLDWNVTTADTLSVSAAVIGGAVGGWTIVPGYLYSLASGTPTAAPSDGIVMASTNPALIVYEDTAKRVEYGYLSAGVYGIKGYDSGGSNVLFELSDTQTIISGWTIGQTTLANGTDIVLDASNKAISINDTTFGNSGIQLEYNGGDPQMYIGDGSNNYLTFTASTGLELGGTLTINTVSSDQLLLNGNFEDWRNGTAVAPNYWILDASVTCAQSDDSKLGTYAASLTNVSGGTRGFYTSFHEDKGATYWQGRTVTLSGWVYTLTASVARLFLNDGTGSYYSDYHGGTGWEFLSTTLTLDGAATVALAGARVTGAAEVIRVDGMMAVEGNSAQNYADKALNYKLPEDDALIGYWSFDEKSGATAFDYSDNANNGTISSGTYTTGTSGTGLDFDGNSGDVQITDAAAIQNVFDGGGSISVWINPDSDGEGDFGRIITKGSDIWTLRVYSESAGMVKVQFVQQFSGDDGIWSSTATEVTINKWAHVVVNYDSSSITNDPEIFVNSVSVALTETATGPSGTYTTDVGSDLFIGNEAGDAATFDGTIDEPRIYNKKLSPDEVKALYFNPGGVKQQGVASDKGLIGGWTINSTTLANGTNIILDASTAGVNPSISIKNATFESEGIQLQYNSGSPQLYVGDGGDQFFKYDATSGTTEHNYSQVLNNPTYGNGIDGDVTIAANTSLTRDMYYNDLTVNITKILDTAGYRIFVKGILTNNGTIQRTPNAGAAGAVGVSTAGASNGGAGGAGGAATADANLSGGLAGRAGGAGAAGIVAYVAGPTSANGTAGSAGTAGVGLANGTGVDGEAGATGGAGGNAVTGTGGAGGAGGAGGTVTTKQFPYAFPECVQMLLLTAGANPALHASSGDTGGSGGGGSGGRDGNAGGNAYSGAGGGGGGTGSTGGIVVVVARIIVNTGSILAPGGDGGNGGNGADCADTGAPFFYTVYGGGGGGGSTKGGTGGVLAILYNKLTDTGTIAASGGAGGTAGTGGAAGTAGTSPGSAGTSTTGATGILIQLQN